MSQKPEQTSLDLDELARQDVELQNKIKQIQSFIHEAPTKLQQEEDDRIRTLPAPDEISERRREKEFFDRLSRGELKNERRHQAKNGVILVLLLITITAVCLWISRYIEM